MRLSNILVVLASASLALAQQAIISRGIIVASKSDIDSDAKGEDVYKHTSNGVIAAASILRKGASLVGYNPSEQYAAYITPVFKAFEWKLTKFPGFKEPKVTYKWIDLNGGPQDLEKAVKDAYDSYDNGLLAKTLREEIPTTNQHKEIDAVGINIVSINKRRVWRHTVVKLVTLRIRIETDDEQRVTVPQQIANLVVEEYELDSHYLEDKAKKLADVIERTSARDFEHYFRTKTVKPEVAWFDAFEQDPIAA
ncbi:hypothetical protein DFQ26_009741 [Actinomortierella ambigua]|nr:hypothetical protein DFQ26_009741 [Actinomortierella ambigua]